MNNSIKAELKAHIAFLDKLDKTTILSIFHNLIELRGNYDNNLTNKELEQYNYLRVWYSDNYSEI